MSDRLIRKPIGDGVHFSCISDPKFKRNRISCNFVLPLDAQQASDNAVVPFVLRMGSRECPDFSTLNARLCELYGAVLDADVTKYGGVQVLEISIQALDNRYALEGEDIIGQCAQLLADIVLSPKLGASGLLDEKDVALQKQYVLDTIEADINDKRSYAISRCLQEMCKGEPVAVRRYGTRETAGRITTQSATAAYRRMLETAQVEILFTGSGDSAAAERIFCERFAAVQRTPVLCPPVNLREKAETVREKTENMELSQSKLVIGMRTGKYEDASQITAARVFAAMFGGTPFSKLFLNVREKLSLCYYCAARFDVSTKLLLIDSGVEAENKALAQEEILRQLQTVQQGDFTDEELFNTKLIMKNSVRSTTDSLSAIEGWYISQILRGQNVSPREDLDRIDAVTREEVVAAAKAVTLDTVYFLTGNEQKEVE